MPQHLNPSHRWQRSATIVLLIGGIFMPVLLGAHAVLIESNPPHGAVLRRPPDTITLRFNAMLERVITQVYLIDGKEHETPLQLVDDPHANQVTAKLPALAPGVYTIRYKVLARDGHVTEGTIRFTLLRT